MENKEKIIQEKKPKKIKNNLAKKDSKFKSFFYGVGKEFERTSWTPKSKLVSDFFIVLVIVLILAAIFTAIAILMVKYIG